MKKKLLFFIVLELICRTPSFATATKVDLSYDHSHDITKGHPYVIPTVTTDDDDVTIKCDSTIYDVDVVIRDQFGNVMHHSTQVIGPNETVIRIPDTGDEREKATIDLYYDKKHLTGYLDD